MSTNEKWVSKSEAKEQAEKQLGLAKKAIETRIEQLIGHLKSYSDFRYCNAGNAYALKTYLAEVIERENPTFLNKSQKNELLAQALVTAGQLITSNPESLREPNVAENQNGQEATILDEIEIAAGYPLIEGEDADLFVTAIGEELALPLLNC